MSYPNLTTEELFKKLPELPPPKFCPQQIDFDFKGADIDETFSWKFFGDGTVERYYKWVYGAGSEGFNTQRGQYFVSNDFKSVRVVFQVFSCDTPQVGHTVQEESFPIDHDLGTAAEISTGGGVVVTWKKYETRERFNYSVHFCTPESDTARINARFESRKRVFLIAKKGRSKKIADCLNSVFGICHTVVQFLPVSRKDDGYEKVTGSGFKDYFKSKKEKFEVKVNLPSIAMEWDD